MQTLKSLKNIMVGLPVFCVEVMFIFVNKFPLSLTIKMSLKKSLLPITLTYLAEFSLSRIVQKNITVISAVGTVRRSLKRKVTSKFKCNI